jgi:hypothetical protein
MVVALTLAVDRSTAGYILRASTRRPSALRTALARSGPAVAARPPLPSASPPSRALARAPLQTGRAWVAASVARPLHRRASHATPLPPGRAAVVTAAYAILLSL